MQFRYYYGFASWVLLLLHLIQIFNKQFLSIKSLNIHDQHQYLTPKYQNVFTSYRKLLHTLFPEQILIIQHQQLILINYHKLMNKLMTQQIIILSAILFAIKTQEEENHQGQHQEEGHLTSPQIWGYGFLACLAVSLIGFSAAGVLALFKRFGNQTCFGLIVRFFFALACGALLGDVLVHILPQAFKSESTVSSFVALIFICSIGFFIILERLFEKCGVVHSHWHDDEKNGEHSHSDHPQQGLEDSTKRVNPEKSKKKSVQMIKLESKQKIAEDLQKGSEIKKPNEHQASSQQIKSDEQNQEGIIESFKGKGSAGYLNLVGSLIHNFIDGLALGVAFATGNTSEAVSVLVAIIAHEIPRQLGDVAVLLKSNFTTSQTICCNGIVNMVSLIGGLIGLGIQSLQQNVKLYILVFVGGNFIFVAADIWKHLLKNTTWYGNFIEIIGFVIGVGIMFLILLLETEQTGHAH